MSPAPPTSEMLESKEDYEILTAWLSVNAPGKPALRVPVKCIRLTAYERLERRLREALERREGASDRAEAMELWKERAEAAERLLTVGGNKEKRVVDGDGMGDLPPGDFRP